MLKRLRDAVEELEGASHDEIISKISRRTPSRLLGIGQAFREGIDFETIRETTTYDPWFLRQIEAIVAAEGEVLANGLPRNADALRRLKSLGFSDARLARLAVRSAGAKKGAQVRARAGLLHDAMQAMVGATSAGEVRQLRHKLGVLPVYKRIDSCAAEFEAVTP